MKIQCKFCKEIIPAQCVELALTDEDSPGVLCQHCGEWQCLMVYCLPGKEKVQYLPPKGKKQIKTMYYRACENCDTIFVDRNEIVCPFCCEILSTVKCTTRQVKGISELSPHIKLQLSIEYLKETYWNTMSHMVNTQMKCQNFKSVQDMVSTMEKAGKKVQKLGNEIKIISANISKLEAELKKRGL